MIKIITFQTDTNSDYELQTRVNTLIGEGKLISLEQTDGYEWKVVFDDMPTNPTTL